MIDISTIMDTTVPQYTYTEKAAEGATLTRCSRHMIPVSSSCDSEWPRLQRSSVEVLVLYSTGRQITYGEVMTDMLSPCLSTVNAVEEIMYRHGR